MKQTMGSPQYTLVSALLVLLLLTSSCDSYGIFANIAVSQKIKSGSLPDGLSPSKVFQISSSDYAFISSGPKLYVKNLVTGSNWRSVSLPGNYHSVQSINGSSASIVLSVARYDENNNYTTALYYFTNTDSNPNYQHISDFTFSIESGYHTIRVFSPNPDEDDFWINVLDFSGDFGEGSFTGSKMYNIQVPQTEDTMADTLQDGFTEALTTKKRFVTSAAGTAEIKLFTAVNAAATEGVLLDNSGTTISYGSEAPMESLTALSPGTGGANAGKGGYIMGSMDLSNSSYPIYASPDGTQWFSVGGANSTTRFLAYGDVAVSSGSGLILAGYDLANDNGGYAEIDVSKELTADNDWFITSRNFADSINYISTDIYDVSVTAFSLIGSNPVYLYASSSGKGLWKINASSTGNNWVEE